MMVSVIIPNCGDSHQVPQAVRNVREQPVETECIVVDNDHEERVRKLSDQPNVRVCHRQPEPPGHNRNVGLAMARGTYIQFLDADDRLKPGGLAPRIEALEQTDASVAVGATEHLELDDTRRVDDRRPPEKPGPGYVRRDWEPCLGAVLCERRVFNEHEFDERLTRAQDMHLWARVFHDFAVRFVDETAFTYVHGPGQRSRKRLHQRYAQQRRALRMLFTEYPDLREAIRWRYRQTFKDELRGTAWGGL